ncbi:hypothetical protein D9M68_437890 [compost metagenome]
MTTALGSVGSCTWMVWKRRVSAGSFSMYFLYSDHVVAPMVRSRPRASAGLSRLAASPVPAVPPAPTSVCTSSTNSTMGLGLFSTSSITWRRRCSNSPFTPAPACSSVGSSTHSDTSFSEGGTSPAARREARPSTTAVLPTPASPVSSGLFWRRRMRMSTIWRISSSRPYTGSSSPARALAVRSLAYLARAEPPAAGASPWCCATGAPPPASDAAS